MSDAIVAAIFAFGALVALYEIVLRFRNAAAAIRRLAAGLHAMSGEPLIAISKLPPELQEPLRPFRRAGVRHLSAAQVRRIFDDCGLIIEGRAQLYERQTALIKAQTTHELAVAAARFVASLGTEERALLHMRIEAQVRFEVDALRSHNAELSAEVAHYRSLLPRR